jgi:nitrogen fixation protein FixH
MNINEILHKKGHFDELFHIEIVDAPEANVELENSKRAKEERSVLLKEGTNRFTYRVVDRNDKPYSDANVTFLLTRPHTRKDDVLVKQVPSSDDTYVIEDINITKPGRYLLQLRVEIDKDTIGYSELPAYLKP